MSQGYFFRMTMVFSFYIPEIAYSTGENWGQIGSNEKNEVVSYYMRLPRFARNDTRN
jgi:hypothetical protein